jgi:DNA-binding transcriptional regulator YiaG
MRKQVAAQTRSAETFSSSQLYRGDSRWRTVIQENRNLPKVLEMTQEQFAQEVGISFSTVSRWETRRGKPSLHLRTAVLKNPAQLGRNHSGESDDSHYSLLLLMCDTRYICKNTVSLPHCCSAEPLGGKFQWPNLTRS